MRAAPRGGTRTWGWVTRAVRTLRSWARTVPGGGPRPPSPPPGAVKWSTPARDPESHVPRLRPTPRLGIFKNMRARKSRGGKRLSTWLTPAPEAHRRRRLLSAPTVPGALARPRRARRPGARSGRVRGGLGDGSPRPPAEGKPVGGPAAADRSGAKMSSNGACAFVLGGCSSLIVGRQEKDKDVLAF